MAGGHSGSATTVKVVIVLTLAGVMYLLQGYDSHQHLVSNQGALALISFGFVVLFAYTAGELAHVVKAPHILAFLLTGLFLGPHGPIPGLRVLSKQVIELLEFFDVLAVALIAMDAGASLDAKALWKSRRVVGILSSLMIVASMVIGLSYAGLTSGVVPLFAVEFLHDGGTGRVIAAGLLIGVMILATSPPVTLAVMNEAKAKGKFTETILQTVIINNIQVVVLLAVVLSAASALVGSAESTSALALLGQIGGALVLGAVISVIVATAFRYLRLDALLILVGLCFVGSFVATDPVLGLHAEPLLVFLAAGAFIRNASKQGEAFRSVATTLSGPVYVVFFTLVGATLHVDELGELAPWAFALVALRLGGYFASVHLTGRLVAVADTVKRYGALGLAPQAGIALVVAKKVPVLFPGWGQGFESLGLAAIALNEMLGPVLLKLSLGWSGESEEARAAQAPQKTAREPEVQDTEDATTASGLATWLPDSNLTEADPWGPRVRTGNRRLDELTAELQGDLASLVRDLRAGPVALRREEAHRFINALRKEFLRVHRRIVVKLSDEELSPEAARRFVAGQRAELAARWKTALLDRAAAVDFRAEEAAIEGIIRSVDRAVDSLPVAMEGEVDVVHLQPAEGDSAWTRFQKAFGRARMRLASGGPSERTIVLRDLARYHLAGHAPIYLVEVAGLLTLAERHILVRSRRLFEMYEATVTEFMALSDETLKDAGDGLRREFEEELGIAANEVDRLADETVAVAAHALGRPYRAFITDLAVVGTPALPPGRFRYSRIYDRRQKSMSRLQEGLSAARDHTRGAAALFAMELELMRLNNQVGRAVEENANEIGRDIRGKLGVQLGRVADSMAEALAATSEALAGEEVEGTAALDKLTAAMEPLDRVNTEAVTIAEDYRAQLQAQSPFQPLLTSMTGAIDNLTDHYSAVFERADSLGGDLPNKPRVEVVPFRDLVRTYLEGEIGRGLRELAEELETEVSVIARGIDDIDRVITFNGELGRSEIEVGGAGPVPPGTLQLVRDMTVGTLERTEARVNELKKAAEELAGRAEAEVRAVTLGKLHTLRERLAEGEIAELRTRLAQRSLAQGRRELRGAASEAAQFLSNVIGMARTTVGEEALTQARRAVGLQEIPHDWLGAGALRELGEQVQVPIAYRRLFTDPSLEAGDLLHGRENEVARIRACLCGETASSTRAAAVVGSGTAELSAVVQMLCRGVSDRARLVRHELTEPIITAEALQPILDSALRAPDGQTTVVSVEGLHWLFSLRPGGFEALRLLVSTVLDTSDRVGWLLSASEPVWAFVERVIPLSGIFPERLHLKPLGPEQLRARLLARHAMSGYELSFRRGEGGFTLVVREAIANTTERQELYEEQFFRNLHRDASGVLGDALRIWLASIVAIDTDHDIIALGAPPFPARRALAELGTETLLTLRQIVRQGTLVPVDHASWFQWPLAESEALLGKLRFWGVVERDSDGSYRIPAHLSGPLTSVLRERGLVG